MMLLPTSAPGKPAQSTYDSCDIIGHVSQKSIKILTAVTFGCSIHGSRIKGPTLCTITIVLLFCAATANTKLSPPYQAVRLFL